MATRPTRIAQTSTEVKRLHKKNGLGLPGRQQRQLERAAELEQRAMRAREQEERRKAAKKKREERERKEHEARKEMGVGVATQLIGYSHTQAQLKSGMETFLGLKRRREEEIKREMEVARNLEAIAEEVAREPWDDDGEEDTLLELPELDQKDWDQWLDDDLDDDTLLEAHDLVMSDPVEESREEDATQPPTAPAPVVKEPKPAAPKEDAEFLRLHGPTNKAIESILDKLPEPLIELLSQDTSTDTTNWDPAPSLLHKLNPIGLPPHRLRIKLGCAVTLLRDLDTSSQLSKSQHLQILRVGRERLECLVLDGQLEGTKTFLTRVAFSAKHRNDTNLLFQRIQFPIQISQDVTSSNVPREPTQSTFKLPSMSGQCTRSISVFKSPSPPTPKSKPLKPSFKLPGLPASKSKPPSPPKPAVVSTLSLFDGWDDFLDSGTQIARELSSEEKPICNPPIGAPVVASSNALPPLLTQDFDFSLEELDDPPMDKQEAAKPSKLAPNMSGPIKPATRPSTSRGLPSPSKPKPPAKPSMAPPSCHGPGRPGLKRKSLPTPTSRTPPHKRKAIPAQWPTTAPKVAILTAPLTSFSQFGLSTQEAGSFFDDDEDMNFGVSPPVAV